MQKKNRIKGEKLMIATTCRRCGSSNIRKNGKKANGKQQIHCKDCNFYSTLDLKTSERQERFKLVESMFLEKLPQRSISRILKMSCTTISKILKKKPK